MPTEPQAPADDAILLPLMEAEARRRTRRYWMWMAFVPGPTLLALVLGVLFLVPYDTNVEPESNIALLLGGAWIIYCTARIAHTWHTYTNELKWLCGIGLALLFALLNSALFFGLLMASCAAFGGLFH